MGGGLRRSSSLPSGHPETRVPIVMTGSRAGTGTPCARVTLHSKQ